MNALSPQISDALTLSDGTVLDLSTLEMVIGEETIPLEKFNQEVEGLFEESGFNEYQEGQESKAKTEAVGGYATDTALSAGLGTIGKAVTGSTPAGIAASLLPMAMANGQPRGDGSIGDQVVLGQQAIQQAPAPPHDILRDGASGSGNISLEPILPIQLPFGDVIRGFNTGAAEAGVGVARLPGDIVNGLTALLPQGSPDTFQSPMQREDYYRNDSQSTR